MNINQFAIEFFKIKKRDSRMIQNWAKPLVEKLCNQGFMELDEEGNYNITDKYENKLIWQITFNK